jgi:DNA repair exonuclease SbcCD ATPase subunit
MTEMSKL